LGGAIDWTGEIGDLKQRGKEKFAMRESTETKDREKADTSRWLKIKQSELYL